jgi:putative peptidoglycan lipid II flippase
MTLDTNQKSAAVRKPGRLGWLSLSHQHSVFSATLLLMVSALLSRLIGLVRIKFVAYLFGAGSQTDAYNAAFQLPDMIQYFLVGGVASVAFINILGRYREEGREEEGEKALAAILSMMLVVLSVAILTAEIFARKYVAWWFSGFSPEKIDLTTHMTRILLPNPLFFFSGGVLASVLIVRKQFAYQALSPLLYNVFIILGAVLLAGRIGVSSLAVGALSGAFFGMFLVNYIGVRRAGVRLWLTRRWGHPGLREWVRLSLPLMIGVSLVTFDTWIINHLASHGDGEIARLNFAKALFTAPMAILGMAAGAASMPFFTALIAQGKRVEFATQVNGAVTRIIAISLLGSACMMVLARWMVVVVLSGGALHRTDAAMIAKYFAVFAVSLFLWSSQSIYVRAFYAAGNTLTPAIAGTVITVVSYPLYSFLYASYGAIGLAVASDIGIFVQTLAMAVLLHRSGLVKINGLDWPELGRAVTAAMVSGGLLFALVHFLPLSKDYVGVLIELIAGMLLWITACWAVLSVMGSKLPTQLVSRFRGRGKPAEAIAS